MKVLQKRQRYLHVFDWDTAGEWECFALVYHNFRLRKKKKVYNCKYNHRKFYEALFLSHIHVLALFVCSARHRPVARTGRWALWMSGTACHDKALRKGNVSVTLFNSSSSIFLQCFGFCLFEKYNPCKYHTSKKCIFLRLLSYYSFICK